MISKWLKLLASVACLLLAIVLLVDWFGERNSKAPVESAPSAPASATVTASRLAPESGAETAESSATPAPTTVSRVEPSKTPQPTEQPKAAEPTATASATKAIFADPLGNPQSIAIRCNDVVLAEASLLAGYYHVNPSGGTVWETNRNEAEWLAEAGWPRPGAYSANSAMITGHVWYGREEDVFYELHKVTVGCLIDVEYDSGDSAVFEAVTTPEPIDKTEFVKSERYDHYWTPEAPGQWLTVVTCDKTSLVRPDGHLSSNVAFKAIRTS